MFTRRSLSDFVSSARAAFRAALPGSDAWLWPNNITPTAKVIGAGLYGIEGRLDYVADQIFVKTSSIDSLVRHAGEYGMARLPAAPASGNVIVAASVDSIVGTGAILTRSDGVTFRVLAGHSVASGSSLSFAVVATAPRAAGVTLAGTILTPTTNVAGSVTVAVDGEGLAGGADIEGIEAFRARILFRKRYAPHGGAASDYVLWTLAVSPAVTRVYVERLWSGPGTVRVFPVTDNVTSGGIPTVAMVALVTEALAQLAPAGAAVTVAQATPQVINITISGLTPNTTNVQEAVLAELRDAFTRLGRVSGGDTVHAGMPFLATAQVFSRSWIWQAVANAAGEERHTVTLPAADVTIAAGAIPVLGTVTFA